MSRYCFYAYIRLSTRVCYVNDSCCSLIISVKEKILRGRFIYLFRYKFYWLKSDIFQLRCFVFLNTVKIFSMYTLIINVQLNSYDYDTRNYLRVIRVYYVCICWNIISIILYYLLKALTFDVEYVSKSNWIIFLV